MYSRRPVSPPTAPPITRGSIPPRPWLGFTRGLLYALLGGNKHHAVPASPWLAAAKNRRRALLLSVLVLAAGATALLPMDDAPMSALHVLQVGLFALLFAWLAAGFITALMGFHVLVRGDRHALPLPDATPIAASARTAIIMPIYNEDIDTVFGGLRKTCESLAATGALRLFDVYVLSDTVDPDLRARELQAWRELRETLGDTQGGGRIFYRLRHRRTKKKAGNVADFCRRWGRNYRYMVVLDADSVMSGDTLVSMVRMMEAHPNTGILQTLPRTHGHRTLHARAQQFASAVTGKLFALGLAYWQLGESHYWGHNAILRVEPFMKHCGLAPIPGRGGLAGEILSHDFVEAALMRRAGYEVWLAPELEGSWEQQPPNLLDELQRDRRWCQGNLQNARLVAEPGIRPVHRAMFVTGALSYAIAPVWLAFVAVGVAMAAWQPGGSPLIGLGWWSPAQAAWGVWALTLMLLLAPRALGVFAVLMKREQTLYGGTRRLLTSAVAELMLSALQAPVRMLGHTAFVLSALTGLKLEWKSPPRDATSIGWRDALSRLGPLALPALALAAFGALTDSGALALVVPLMLAMPLVVLGSRSQGREGPLPALLQTPQEHAIQVRHGVALPLGHRPAPRSARALARARAVRWSPGWAAAMSPAVLAAALTLPQPLAVVAPVPRSVTSEMDTRYVVSDAAEAVKPAPLVPRRRAS